MKLNKYQKAAIISNIMGDVPKVDVAAHRKEIQAAVVKEMSPAVRKVYKECPDALRKEYRSDLYDGVSWDSRYVIIGDVTEARLDELMKPLSDAIVARDDVCRKLRGVVESCTTLKKLEELLPEFKAYFPTEEAPTKNLPAVANLVTDMMKLGWPKGKTKGETK